MRLFLGLSLLGCSDSAQTVDPAPEPTVELASTKVNVDLQFSAVGMIRIEGGIVQLGPRHVPSSAHGGGTPETIPKSKQPLPQYISLPDTTLPATPWRSRGGLGLTPRMASVTPFLIDKTEVTQAAYAQFLDGTGYRLPHVAESWADDGWNWNATIVDKDKSLHPVTMVSFHDAHAYCRWRGKRLPTEAEWQLAALGSAQDRRTFPWGDRYQGDRVNHGRMESPNFDGSDGYDRTAPVGSFSSGNSIYGLEDSFGNAWEYTSDLRVGDWSWARHDGFDAQGAMVNARVPGPGLRVAVRGGSFYFDFEPHPGGEWSAFVPESRRKSAGFRCAADVKPG